MAVTLEQLGQLRPANTTAASLFSPTSGEVLIKTVVVCNTSGASAKYRVFLDDDGTTYDETSALFWDIELPADTTDTIEINLMMDNTSGNLAVRTDTNSAITFTATGSVVS